MGGAGGGSPHQLGKVVVVGGAIRTVGRAGEGGKPVEDQTVGFPTAEGTQRRNTP